MLWIREALIWWSLIWWSIKLLQLVVDLVRILSQNHSQNSIKLPLAPHQFSSVLSSFFLPPESWSNGHLCQKEISSATKSLTFRRPMISVPQSSPRLCAVFSKLAFSLSAVKLSCTLYFFLASAGLMLQSWAGWLQKDAYILIEELNWVWTCRTTSSRCTEL